MAQITNIIRLSFRDYSHEWRMSGCFILALSSVLAPMMILFGLKFGIVSAMVNDLVENPANREIRPIGSGRYDDAWIEAFRNRDEVEFIIPKTRALAATIQLKSDKAKRILSTELMATAAGDPLLRGLSSVPRDYYQVVLSQSAANKLKVKSGDQIDASLNELAGWELKNEKLHRELRFKNFVQAWGFMTQAAILAERMNHHPEWSNVYSKVIIDLTTHEAGGISQLDFDLAKRINGILAGMGIS